MEQVVGQGESGGLQGGWWQVRWHSWPHFESSTSPQGRDQREWVFEVREVKSENKKLSLFFEKCKVKKKMLSLFFEKCKVKSKCFHSFSRSEK